MTMNQCPECGDPVVLTRSQESATDVKCPPCQFETNEGLDREREEAGA